MTKREAIRRLINKEIRACKTDTQFELMLHGVYMEACAAQGFDDWMNKLLSRTNKEVKRI